MVSDYPNVVILVGGSGGVKLAHGLALALPPEKLTVVVNTGDDFWHYGLRICPDLDTLLYTLSGQVNREHGWGISGDTTVALNTLRTLGDDTWFTLGDRDLATHLRRTQLWHEGHTLTQIAGMLGAALGIESRILPMTDSPVATIVETAELGDLPFQTYFVRHRWQPTVRAVRYDGIEAARLSPELVAALQDANVIILGPSNPWLSIDPILAVPGMREAIRASRAHCIAVTPIVGGDAVKGPTARLMRDWGLALEPQTIADHYAGLIDGFVADQRDESTAPDGIAWLTADTMMTTDEDRLRVARVVLDWAADFSRAPRT
jgi:LPPG:FO 2-phospho-L-lactate transferase